MIIADTSILSTFARIQRLDLLFAVAETQSLHLPPAVQKEIKLGLQKRAHNFCIANNVFALDLKRILRQLWKAGHCSKDEVQKIMEDMERSEPGMVIKGKDEILR
jgi:predicted nucleic acid-binding protein